MEQYKIPYLPLGYDLETKEVLKQVNLFMTRGEYGQQTGETIITHKEIGNSLL